MNVLYYIYIEAKFGNKNNILLIYQIWGHIV